MSPDEKEKKDKKQKAAEAVEAPGKDSPDRVLLNPEEWKEPSHRKVLGEYHKEGLPETALGGEADLDSFVQYWHDTGKVKVRSEYHKAGAPYIEGAPEGRGAEPAGAEQGEAPEPEVPGRIEPGRRQRYRTARPAGVPPIERVIDITTIEVIAFALFRAFFGHGVRVPIKREGLVDMELLIRDKEILLNTNSFQLEMPELAVWRIVLAYKGRPLVEFGHGVKNRLKIHRFRVLMLLFSMWWQARRKKPDRPAVSEGAGGAEEEEGADSR